jgi:phage shock protein C
MAKRLVRSMDERKLAGVCGGFGEYFGIDPVLLRVGLIAVTVTTGFVPGIAFYIGAWVVMPEPMGGAKPDLFESDRDPS